MFILFMQEINFSLVSLPMFIFLNNILISFSKKGLGISFSTLVIKYLFALEPDLTPFIILASLIPYLLFLPFKSSSSDIEKKLFCSRDSKQLSLI